MHFKNMTQCVFVNTLYNLYTYEISYINLIGYHFHSVLTAVVNQKCTVVLT